MVLPQRSGSGEVAETLLLGVDLGTSSTKAALYDRDGRQLAEAIEPTPLRWHGPDRCDQEPDDFYRAALSTVRCCLDRAQTDPAQVQAIGVAGQMAGVMGVDKDFRPSTPYDSWLDLRCAPEVEYLERAIGDEMTWRTGCPPMVDHAPKMRWWKAQQPAVYAHTAKFIVPGGYVAGRLAGLTAGDAFIDHTYLHFTGLADAQRVCWSESLVHVVDVDADKLPRIVAPATRVGGLCAEAATASGLPRGVPIAAGLGDTAACALGAGIVRPGQLLDVAGTAAVFTAAGSRFRPDIRNRTLLVMRGPIENQWLSLAYLSGGSLLAWAATCLRSDRDGAKNDAIAFTRAAADAPAGSRGLVFIPFLDGRILPTSPTMRGGWAGLNRHHRQEHMIRAILESVAYEYANYLGILQELDPDLRPSDARVTGGGARSDLWNRVKASVLGLPYHRLNRDECGCWGAALTAGKAVGLFDDLALAAGSSTRSLKRYDPDPAETALYRHMTTVYRSLLDGLQEPFAKLAALQRETVIA